MPRVVITGITGKSGQFLLKRLIAEKANLKDYQFILLCRPQNVKSKNPAGYQLLKDAMACKELNIRIEEADLTCPKALDTFFQCCHADMLLHIASVKLSWNIVPAALKHGVDNLILVHTTGIYSKYKAAGEEYRQIEAKIHQLVAEYKEQGRRIAMTILRPTMIYGDLADKNISVFIRMVDKLRIFPTVNGARYDLQPVWCKDLGYAFYEVMTKWQVTRNKEYILSGGAPIQLREIFLEIAKQLGVKNTFISCPFWLACFGAWCIYLATLGKIDFREKVQRLVEPRAYGHEAAAKDFGYAPAPFAIGIREEIEMYKAEKR